MDDALTVVDNTERRRFEMAIGDEVAIADYRLNGNVVTIYHTEVPLHLRGRGFGNKLVRGVLDYLRASNLLVVPQCPFVAVFIEDNPSYRDLLA